ncbi:hypothetical protein MK805_14165 [Shimazuella sp. AN120528]|uniref:hypothetical protein n=1 Tax=Shimazuella soli TaxID=1892854 RepID=UPI001F0DC815|nr:hypothetical protein [Shimazuella soli]MCH5586083.1 hypothetical protein [Shimazuella soli]
MEFHTILALSRHLNPLNWYIRAIFLIGSCYFAYKRSWIGLVSTFVFMTLILVGSVANGAFDNLQMQAGLEYEKILFHSPLSTLAIVFVYLMFAVLLCLAFWKHSIKLGLIIWNIYLVGKILLGYFYMGDSAWTTISYTIFGLIIINRVGLYLLRQNTKRKLHKADNHNSKY